MATNINEDFERQMQVSPSGQRDVFTNRYPTWHHPHSTSVNGAILLAQSTLSAYETVPQGFAVYAVQAQFLKPVAAGLALEYDVQRISTSSRAACRAVLVKRDAIVRALVICSFMAPSKEDIVPQLFDHIPEPSKETLKWAAVPMDPELDDSDQGSRASNSRMPKGWPASTPYPAVQNQRLSITQDKDVSKRVYRCKIRTRSSLSSPTAQIVATLFFSDFYVLDTPTAVQDLSNGFYEIGDKTKTPNRNVMKNWATLNHTVQFCRSDGWDVHDGLLLECVTRWAKGRKAVTSFSMRDTKGKLVATGEQEGYYLFKERLGSEKSKM